MTPRRASAPVVIEGPYRGREPSPLALLIVAVLLVLGCLGAVHIVASIVEAMP